jgi:hypothetical protein
MQSKKRKDNQWERQSDGGKVSTEDGGQFDGVLVWIPGVPEKDPRVFARGGGEQVCLRYIQEQT